jgi:hypothetical protein
MLCTTPSEADDAEAIIAIEIYRHDPSSPLVRQMADRLKAKGGASLWAEILWRVLDLPKITNPTPAPPKGNQPVSVSTRIVYVGLWTLKGQHPDALELAKRPGTSNQSQVVDQLRGLALYAEWAPDAGPAIDHAVQVAGRHKKGEFPPPPFVVLRLVQLAAAAGKTEQAKQLAESIPDEGLREWAKAEITRQQSAPTNRSPLDPGSIAAPDNPKSLRAGHAWAHLWLACHNARISGDRTKETDAIALWQKGTIQPFGLVGIALGLKEQ